jgi:hypothetical protein
MSSLVIAAKQNESRSQHLEPSNWLIHTDKLFPIEMFLDISNINIWLRTRGYFHANYGELVDIVGRRFTERLGITFVRGLFRAECVAGVSGEPIAFCRHVWGVTSVPANYHPEDENRVRGYRRFLTALRLKHGFNVEEVPLDFCGYHFRREDRLASRIRAERRWRRRERCVDVALATRLLKRCMSPDAPAGVIVVSGDADFAPALREIARRTTPIVVMVAGFAEKLSSVYWSGGFLGYSWRFPPILLDECVAELNDHTQAASA